MKNKNPRIPENLIPEILLRLPAKALVRFKCVEKSWLSLISDPNFAKSHYDLTEVKNNELIIRMSVNIYGPNINKVRIVALDLEEETLQKRPVELFCPIYTRHYRCSKIRNACRGFILFEYSIPVSLLVWNPTTGAIKAITSSLIMGQNPVERGFNLGGCKPWRSLVYDALRDDYLVIQAWIGNFDDDDDDYDDENDDDYDYDYDDDDENDYDYDDDDDYGGGGVDDDDDDLPCLVHCIEFFSMRTNSWTKLDAIYVPCAKKKPHFLFLNGVIHWLAISDDGKLVKGITAFDLAERKVYEIPLPYDDFLYKELKFGVTGGCLCLWNSPMEQPGTVERWVMKEYKVKSSWTKFNHVLAYAISHPRFIPIHFTKSGFVGVEDPNKIVKLNDKGELLCCYYDDYPWRLHKFRNYTESLLSLPCECSQAGEKYYLP